MSTEQTGKYVYWLLPDDKATAYFQSLISGLAKKYSTTAFQPHITIARPPDRPTKKHAEHIKSIAKRGESFHAKVKKVWCKKPWNEKISVEIEPTSSLQELLSVIDDEFGGNYSTKEYHHLSLLYGEISCEKLKMEVQHLNHSIMNRFRITHIALVHIFGEPNEWEIVEEQEL